MRSRAPSVAPIFVTIGTGEPVAVGEGEGAKTVGLEVGSGVGLAPHPLATKRAAQIAATLRRSCQPTPAKDSGTSSSGAVGALAAVPRHGSASAELYGSCYCR